MIVAYVCNFLHEWKAEFLGYLTGIDRLKVSLIMQKLLVSIPNNQDLQHVSGI